MMPSRMRWLRSSTFSLVLLVALQGTSCFEFDSTTRFERDGTGTTSMNVGVNMAMLEGIAGEEFTASEFDSEQMDRELTENLEAGADTLAGVRYDTAWVADEGDWRRFHARFSFDNPEGLAALFRSSAAGLEESEVGPAPSSAPVIRFRDGTVHVAYTPDEIGEEDPTERMGRMFAMSMIQGASRFVFPEGTEVTGANPPVSTSDTAVVWELAVSDLMGGGSADSLYVSAVLPSPWSAGSVLALVFGALLLVALLFFALRRAR